MSVTQLPCGRFLVRVYLPGSTRARQRCVRLRFKSQDVAKDWDRRFRQAKDERNPAKLRRLLDEARGRHYKASTFGDLVTLYIDNYVRLHNRDVGTKKIRLANLRKHLAGILVAYMTQMDIARYKRRRRRPKNINGRKVVIGNSTINRELVVLQHMMRWALEEASCRRTRSARSGCSRRSNSTRTPG